MFIGYPTRFEVFGAVKIYELTKIYSIFAYGLEKPGSMGLPSFRDLEEIANRTVFVVPVKNEEPLALDGVLRAIPYHSPVVVVSNSSQRPFNMYKVELDIARSIYRTTGRTVVVIHQKDRVIAERIGKTLPDILDEDGLIRDGKGEGMLIGTIIAEALKAENVAFIDADNNVPSTVLEYALTYYTALGASDSKYKMIRIMWAHKAWFSEELYLRRFGRVSTLVNTVFNKVLSYRKVRETDILKTSNSGEHAMTIELAKSIEWGSGFSVETRELVSILEMCYIGLGEGLCPSLPENIEVFQIESLSPHIHTEKGEEHLMEMLLVSLSTIYHSKIPNEKGKTYILNTVRDIGFTEELPQIPKYRYPEIDAKEFLDALVSDSSLTLALGL